MDNDTNPCNDCQVMKAHKSRQIAQTGKPVMCKAITQRMKANIQPTCSNCTNRTVLSGQIAKRMHISSGTSKRWLTLDTSLDGTLSDLGFISFQHRKVGNKFVKFDSHVGQVGVVTVLLNGARLFL